MDCQAHSSSVLAPRCFLVHKGPGGVGDTRQRALGPRVSVSEDLSLIKIPTGLQLMLYSHDSEFQLFKREVNAYNAWP